MTARTLAAALASLALLVAVQASGSPSAADEPPAAPAAEQPKVAEKEFKPPPGFKTRKRGELVLYCIKDSTVGTRFKTEKCYDESQMRDYLAAQQEQKRDIDRVRNTCSTGTEYCVRQ